MQVAERIAAARDDLTKAERRVAEVILGRPQAVAFGTVAELAEQAQSGAATVVRLASKLQYDGFTGLQAAVQAELEDRLRPAVQRIRQLRPDDVLGAATEREAANVHETMEAIDRDGFARACAVIGDPARRVVVVSGEATRGVAIQGVGMLSGLRPGVELLDGNPVSVAGRVSAVAVDDVVIAIDLRRYESWVLDTVEALAARRATVVAITDSRLSPLAASASATFVVAAESAGPFDSHVGTLVVLNALVAGVADVLQGVATQRLDAIERAWRDQGLLLDR